MATARKHLIDAECPLHYHLVSRCVRSSYLCGKDRQSGRNYSHRRAWLEDRLLLLGQHFAVEVAAYAIMSNHFHIVIYHDPRASREWSDAEVARRWCTVFPVRHRNGLVDTLATAVRQEAISKSPSAAAKKRQDLGSVSMFMKYLKQPIARRANEEDGCQGHFWEQRFYSGAILDQESLVAAMAYVDLNPVRANIARSIEACRDTSIHRRLKGFNNNAKRLKKAIRPLVSGLGSATHAYGMTFERYLQILERHVKEHLAAERRSNRHAIDSLSIWGRRIAAIGKRQRAYGAKSALDAWLAERNFRSLETPLPQ